MINLNSVLIEGTVKQTQVQQGSFNISLSVLRSSTTDKEDVFCVRTTGVIAERCEDWCKEGTQMRVVGRLQQTDNGVVVFAEHVEFKHR